jgi:hypothetical protein
MNWFDKLKWWLQKRCLKCGGARQLRAHVSYRGETWVAISRKDYRCLACGDITEAD